MKAIRASLAMWFFIVILLFPSQVRAEVKIIPLKELVAKSDLIVVAKVTKVDVGPTFLNPPDFPLSSVKVATAQVLETWKGINVTEIRYIASPTWQCDSSRADKNEKVVLFLQRRSNSPFLWITHSGRGRMPICEFEGRTYATFWRASVRLPEATTTLPGPEDDPTEKEWRKNMEEIKELSPGVQTEPSFLLSVELHKLKDLVRSEGKTGNPKGSGANGTNRLSRNFSL